MKRPTHSMPAGLQALAPAARSGTCALQWQCARVAQRLPDGAWRLADGRPAAQALSCLVTPEAQDRVVVLQAEDGLYITHVLGRAGSSAQLSAPGMEVLSIAQPELALQADTQIALRAPGDIALTSSHGSVCLAARNVVASAADSLVHNARHWITQVQHAVLQASALLRVQGGQALITADQDLKIDAERVTLG